MTQLFAILGRFPAHWLSLVLLTVYLFTYAGVTHSIDELAALTVTESLLLEQSWHTNQMAWDRRIPPQNAPGLDGNLYSKKGLGVSLLALPLFALRQLWPAVGAVQVTLLLNSFLTVATVYLFYRLTVALHFSTTTAAIGTLTLGLATPLWPYARTLFSESLAAFGLALALLGAVSYRQAAQERPAATRLFWSSGGLAILVLARWPMPVGGALSPLYRLCELAQTMVKPAFPAQLPGMVCFGFAAGRGGPIDGTLQLCPLSHLAYLSQAPFETLHTSLHWLNRFAHQPGQGCAVVHAGGDFPVFRFTGMAQREACPEYALAAALMVITLLFYAKWYDWTGGRAWGPRLLVMTTPALLVLCLPVLDRPCTRPTVLYVGGLAVCFCCPS